MKFKRYFEPVFVTIFILGLSIVNILEVIYQLFRRPTNTVFIGISHYYQDYFYYLTQVTQGARGAWLVRNLYTTDPIPAVPLWWVNVLLGKISAITGLAVWTVYDCALFFCTVISLWLFYRTAKKLFPREAYARLGTFLIGSLTTCYYAIWKNPDGTFFVYPFRYFYDYTPAFNRLGGVVHLVVQNILSLSLILTVSHLLEMIFFKHTTIKRLIQQTLLVSIVSALLLSINPLYLAVDVASIVIVTIGYLIMKPHRFRALGNLSIVAGISVVVLAIPTIIVIKSFSIPFYQYFRTWEASVAPTSLNTFFHSFGFILALGIVGVIPYVSKGTVLRVLGLVWAILPITLYFSPIPKMLGLPYFRLHQPPAYIFFGAIVTEALLVPGYIMLRLRKRNIIVPLFTLLVILYLALQTPVLYQEVSGKVNDPFLGSWMNHVDKKIIEGLSFLSTQPRNKNAIAFHMLEYLVPIVSGQAVYAAHGSLTPDYGGKIADLTRFYTNQMTVPEASSFLDANNIGYVLWKTMDGPPVFARSYPFLSPLYENSAIIIYRYVP